ncbi:hypothetical protein ACFFSW_14110 [Saccharothrix longispora]|uniref:Uncharacterized protein n=1 Tax=Saccharothrix longispora TaxID=33920 RepID=A0ABU1PYR7_9PSEU|nr:hypothetical protein [Saccharothrix longispora]MDR6595790.1 hypothetical protein [Saccharothrix longispora]
MAGTRGQVVTSLGIHLEEGVPIDLRGSLESTAFLTIGDGIEVVLGESHLRVLRDRADAALGDMALVGAAQRVLGDVDEAGAQACTAAAFARAEAEAARRAGAEELAASAFAAAGRAARAAERARDAVRAAVEAMESADDAAERARYAALTARAATGG